MRQTIIVGESFTDLLPCLVRRIGDTRKQNPFHSDLVVVPGYSLVRYLEEYIARRSSYSLLNIHILPLRFVLDHLYPPGQEMPAILSSAALLAFARYILIQNEAFSTISSFEGVERGFQRTLDEMIEAGFHDPEIIEYYLNDQDARFSPADRNMLKVFPKWLKEIRSISAFHPGLAISAVDIPLSYNTVHIYGFLTLNDIRGEALRQRIMIEPPEELIRYHPGVRSLTESPIAGLEYSRELLEQEIGATVHIVKAHEVMKNSPKTGSGVDADLIESCATKSVRMVQNRTEDIFVTAAPGIEAEVSHVAGEIICEMEKGNLQNLGTIGIILAAKDRMIDVFRRVFKEYSIPIRIAGTVQGMNEPEIQWLYEFLLLAATQYPVEDVFSVLNAPWSTHSSLFTELPLDEIRKRFSDSGIHVFQGSAWRSVTKEYAECTAVLEALFDGFHSLLNARDTITWSDRFNELLNSHGVATLFENDVVIRWKRECEDFQILDSHFNGMDRAGSILLDCARTRLLECRMQITPPSGEGVVVGSLQDLFGMEFDRLFIVGVNRGVLPGVISEDPLLSDATRMSIATDLGFPVRTRASRYQTEKLLFTLMVFSATRSVHLSYSTIDDSGKPLAPSILISLVLGGGHRVRTIPYRLVERMEDLDNRGRLMTPRNIFWLIDKDDVRLKSGWGRLSSLLDGEYLSILTFGASRRITRYGTQKLSSYDIQLDERYDTVTNPLHTVQAWNDLDECPFRFFLRHVLGFKDTVVPKETWWLDELEIGNLVHKFFYRVLAAEQTNAGIPPEELVHTAWQDVCSAHLEKQPQDGLALVRRYHLSRAGNWIKPLGIEEIQLIRRSRLTENIDILREVPLSRFSLSISSGGRQTHEVPMNIRADRIDTIGGSLSTRESCIIDYKVRSDSNGWKKDAVNMQLFLYTKAYSIIMKSPVRMEYIEIVRRGLPTDVQTLRVPADEMIEELFETKLQMLSGLWFGTDRMYPFIRDRKICEYCGMRQYCRRFDAPLLEKSTRLSGAHWTMHDDIDNELRNTLKAHLEKRYT